MFNLTTLNYFLLVAWPCLQYILLQFIVKQHYHFTFYTQSKRLLPTIIHCSLYKISSFALGRSAALVLDPWSFSASHSLIDFINRCTWKSSQYYITISMMTSFMRASQKLAFHQSKCTSATKCILSTTATYLSSCSFMYLCIPCYCDACLKSSALRVGVKTLHNTMSVHSTWHDENKHDRMHCKFNSKASLNENQDLESNVALSVGSSIAFSECF